MARRYNNPNSVHLKAELQDTQENLIKLNGEMYKSIKLRDLKILSVINTSRQKTSKYIEDLNNIINYLTFVEL